MKDETFTTQEMNKRNCFSLFQSLTSNKPSTSVTLEEVYRLITSDSSLKECTEKFRYFRSQGFDADADLNNFGKIGTVYHAFDVFHAHVEV